MPFAGRVCGKDISLEQRSVMLNRRKFLKGILATGLSLRNLNCLFKLPFGKAFIADDNITKPSPTIFRPRIKVFGIGNAGTNAVNRMVEEPIDGVEVVAVNTDIQVLDYSRALSKIQIGSEVTGGRGAGANPAIGRQAALQDKDRLLRSIKTADIIFVVAGMGGGTGTGAAPVIADIAKEFGIPSIGVVTMPFDFEGRTRKIRAENGLNELRRYTNTIVIISNDSIYSGRRDMRFITCMNICDDYMKQAVQSFAAVRGTGDSPAIDRNDITAIIWTKGGNAAIGRGVGRIEETDKGVVRHF